jgi:hypothetical protein
VWDDGVVPAYCFGHVVRCLVPWYAHVRSHPCEKGRACGQEEGCYSVDVVGGCVEFFAGLSLCKGGGDLGDPQVIA